MSITDPAQVLADAARRAQHAPSILNTQPWGWRVRGEVLELFADDSRQIRSIDPEGRLLTLSCGAALHHARAWLAATRHEVEVTRFPNSSDPNLLASLRLIDNQATDRNDMEALNAIGQRHTDRRPFAATALIPDHAISSIKHAAELEEAWLYQIPRSQIPFLAQAEDEAAAAEAGMGDYQADLERWTHRPEGSGEGVPAETVTAQVSRPVPIRDFTSGRKTLLDPAFGDDRFAEFLILATSSDTREQWLRAGEATSAVWLAATSAGLVVSVLSDVVEIPDARTLLRHLLRPPGCPQLVFRMGLNIQPSMPIESPRRAPADSIGNDQRES